MRYGDPDGHGVYGQLTTGDDGGLICHECGQERQFLGRHVREHGMTAATYREAHGLGRRTSLASEELRATWGERSSERVGSPEWRRFEAARDPQSARKESRAALREPLRAQALESRREQALAASRSRPARVCEVPGCGRKHVTKGWCRTHLERYKRTGDVQADVPVRPRKGGPEPR
ncbi:MucR family transcriptional regulator [Nocardiopsis sp. L17-MgMaSL7]|uniref:MucR family transcriptional regulator n=1 Tax=Nocardiopsis sp. L17-MgMaSL7 TaxID=1938893 RepID=UPI000D71BBAE|nr:ROS/MUCR transcriptional regulator protein [Nocardiopsis sp. L17-MgMaSL7]